jgi:hypothetical protein
LRPILARDFSKYLFTFEAEDIVSQIMGFGSPTPIEVAVNGIHLSAEGKVVSGIDTLQGSSQGHHASLPSLVCS